MNFQNHCKLLYFLVLKKSNYYIKQFELFFYFDFRILIIESNSLYFLYLFNLYFKNVFIYIFNLISLIYFFES